MYIDISNSYIFVSLTVNHLCCSVQTSTVKSLLLKLVLCVFVCPVCIKVLGE